VKLEATERVKSSPRIESLLLGLGRTVTGVETVVLKGRALNWVTEYFNYGSFQQSCS
jgi:hypothetical protein